MIRAEKRSDQDDIRDVNGLSCGEDDEARLVEALRDGSFARMSLVAEIGDRVVGHILFSDLPMITPSGRVEAVSLAPLAVVPAHQRKGIGTLLVSKRGFDPVGWPGIGSPWSRATRSSIPGSGSRVRHSWPWSWCRGRYTLRGHE